MGSPVVPKNTRHLQRLCRAVNAMLTTACLHFRANRSGLPIQGEVDHSQFAAVSRVVTKSQERKMDEWSNTRSERLAVDTAPLVSSLSGSGCSSRGKRPRTKSIAESACTRWAASGWRPRATRSSDQSAYSQSLLPVLLLAEWREGYILSRLAA